MRKWALVVLMVGVSGLHAQGASSLACWAEQENKPRLVANPSSTVTFKCRDTTRLALIRAVGRQTRIPIGVAMSEDAAILTKTREHYDLVGVDAKTALREAIVGTGYSLKEKDGVLVLMAGDMTAYQRKLLTYRLRNFHLGSDDTVTYMNFKLNMWLDAEIDPKTGYAADMLGQTDDEKLPNEVIAEGTVESIANRIVSFGSNGMWIFSAEAVPTKGSPMERMIFESYQHFSNRPLTDR